MEMTGFSATLKFCKERGLDCSAIPPGLLGIFYNAGVAFAAESGMTAQDREKWRDDIAPRKVVVGAFTPRKHV